MIGKTIFSRSLLRATYPATIHFRSLFELALGFGQRKVAYAQPGCRHTPVHRQGTQTSSHARYKKWFSRSLMYHVDCKLE
ncbi:MAG: hypothetical protein H6Q53_1176 [Deltaproteobacteria bacterium]|nr:hypothetical protein [Deltaproteobacteria bacterium]